MKQPPWKADPNDHAWAHGPNEQNEHISFILHIYVRSSGSGVDQTWGFVICLAQIPIFTEITSFPYETVESC